MEDSDKFWGKKFSEIKNSPIKWHKDLIYLLEIVYSLTNCMNDNHLRNILLYEAFNEATEEFEKKPYIYFKDAMIYFKLFFYNKRRINSLCFIKFKTTTNLSNN